MLQNLFLFSVFLDYVRPGSFLPIISLLKLYTLIPLTVMVITIFYKKTNAHKAIFQHYNTKLILFFMLLLAISIAWADVTLYSYNIFKVVLGFVIWYYIVTRITLTIGFVHRLFFVLAISHLFLLFLNLPVILDPATRHYLGDNAFLGDGNDFSLSVCIALPMIFYLIQESKRFIGKLFFIVAILLLIVGIIGTQSRGATVALVCVLLYLWWMGRRKLLGLFLLGAVGLLVVNYAPPEYFERINTIFNYQEEGSAQGRLTAWKAAIRMAVEYPLTGVGSGHFPVKFGTEFRPTEFGDENLPWLTAHSSYFLVLGELGFPGLACFLALIVGNFIKNQRLAADAAQLSTVDLQRYRRLFVALNGSLVAYAVGGAFLSVAYYPHIYVLAGLFTAVQLLFNKERMAQEGPGAAGKEASRSESRAARKVVSSRQNK